MSDKLPPATATLIRRLRRLARSTRAIAGADPRELARANTCEQAAGRLEDLETDLAELSAPAPGLVFVYRGRPLEQLTREELLVAASLAWKEIETLRRVISVDQDIARAFTEAEGKLRT